VQHVLDLHLKLALRPHQSATAENRRGKKEERRRKMERRKIERRNHRTKM